MKVGSPKQAALISRIRQVQVAGAESRARSAGDIACKSATAETAALELYEEQERAWAAWISAGSIDPCIALGFASALLGAEERVVKARADRRQAEAVHKHATNLLLQAQRRRDVSDKLVRASRRQAAAKADEGRALVAEDRWRWSRPGS